jgi:hypothetical protein
MTWNRWIAIAAASALLALPALSLANHHEAGEEAAEDRSDQAGEEAAEHRSDKAAEKSNAQWDEDNEGKDEKNKKDKKGKEDKKGKKDKKD